jgi:predicted nucleic acid-binding protein
MMMSNRIYLLDTNIISGLRPNQNPHLWAQVATHKDDQVGVCEPIIFEVERGLLKRNATTQLRAFREQILPSFAVLTPTLLDWRAAAVLWADARTRGRQLSDVDVLLAAMTLRLDAILVTDDHDFAHLPLVKIENWIRPQP